MNMSNFNLNRFIRLTPVASLLLLAACATPGYECRMGHACAPVHDTYRDAVRDQGTWRPVWNVRGASYKSKEKAHRKKEPAKFVMGGPQASAPVYQPPRPWRVWLAPWVDTTGDLHSGEYVWFVTPGKWYYGGKTWSLSPLGGRDNGSGSFAGLGPTMPSALGFIPSLSRSAPGVLPSITPPQDQVVKRHAGTDSPAQ